MGIQVEFNPDLALRNIAEFKNGNRKESECLPEQIEAGMTYEFLKEGQRNYYIQGEVPLLETKGNQQLSKPLASIIILEATHILVDSKLFTKGKYKIVQVFDPDDNKTHFNGFEKVTSSKQ